VLRQRLVYGVTASAAKVTELRSGQRITLTTGAVSNDVLGEIMPVRDFPISKLVEVGAYVQDDIHWGAQWSLIPALRVDYYDLSPKPDAIYIEDNGTQAAVSIRHVSLSPKLGVVYQLNQSASLFAQYVQGFRSQPMEDVNIGLRIPTQNIRAIPNPDLLPEKSRGYETGVRVEGESLRSALSVYYTEYRDFIESKRNIGRDPNDPATTLFQSQNIARAHIYGVEADVHWRMDSIGDALSGWSLATSASYTRGADDVRHVPLNSVNPAEAVLKLMYETPSRTWAGDVAVRTVAAKDNVYTPPTAPAVFAQTSSYTTVDAYVHWRLSDVWRVDVGIVNAFDRRYQLWADVRERAFNDPQLPLFYQPGRSAVAAVKWSWR
jgi:hemoglobin/transferrin/lactoferrin receptor protein